VKVVRMSEPLAELADEADAARAGWETFLRHKLRRDELLWTHANAYPLRILARAAGLSVAHTQRIIMAVTMRKTPDPAGSGVRDVA